MLKPTYQGTHLDSHSIDLPDGQQSGKGVAKREKAQVPFAQTTSEPGFFERISVEAYVKIVMIVRMVSIKWVACWVSVGAPRPF